MEVKGEKKERRERGVREGKREKGRERELSVNYTTQRTHFSNHIHAHNEHVCGHNHIMKHYNQKNVMKLSF